MKQKHTAWVCMGYNNEAESYNNVAATWFYVFRTLDKSLEFIRAAEANPNLATIYWHLWPCNFREVDESLAALENSVLNP